MTQEQMILAHLEKGYYLTVAEALNRFGIYALSQRCGELKRQGHDIRSEMVKDGRKRYARYYLAMPTNLFGEK